MADDLEGVGLSGRETMGSEWRRQGESSSDMLPFGFAVASEALFVVMLAMVGETVGRAFECCARTSELWCFESDDCDNPGQACCGCLLAP